MRGTKIVVMGVGGGGCKVVDRTAEMAGDDVAIVAVNTDARALAGALAPSKLQIGRGRTEGLGTGGDAALGRVAAEDDIEMIRAATAEASLVFAVVCLGGGTGTGAAPIILETAREAGALTLCLATLPFGFEGPQRKAQADRAVTSLREACNALIVVPNDRLFEFVGAAGLQDTFAKADEVLSTGIAAICKLLTKPGYINLDFANLQRVVQNGGLCTLGYGDGWGERKAQAAVAALLDGPLTEQGEIVANAGALLVSIVGGPDLTVKEIGEIMEAIGARASRNCSAAMGTVVDEGWRGRVTVTAIASEGSAAPPEESRASDIEQNELGRPAGRGRKKAGARAQTSLKLDAVRGRFKDVEPTMHDGEDLDIPTFIRRGIPIER